MANKSLANLAFDKVTWWGDRWRFLSSPVTVYLGPLPRQVGTILPQLSPLWSNLRFQACQTWFREEWLQLWCEEMVCKYQLNSWGIDWQCWRVAPLSVCSVHLKLEIFCYPPPGEDYPAAAITTSELWFRSSPGLDFSPFLPKVFLSVWVWMFISLTCVIASCIPVWRISGFGDIHV